MGRYSLVCMTVVALMVSVVVGPVFSEEGQQPVTNAPAETSPAKEGISQPEEISIYGEVQSVNPTSDTVTLKYYDYDADEEKTVEIISNEDTKIEAIANLNDLKQGDWVDATYLVSEGKNIAKSIKAEKEERVPEETALENAPVETSKE